MKKLFYSFFAAASLMFAATSCSQEEMIQNETSGDEVEVMFNVEMEGQTASRAIADGLTVDQLIFAVFDENNQEITTLRQEDVVVSNKGAQVKTRLVKGQSYQFVFWAQKKDAGHYNTTSMKHIKLNTTVLNNDETRDAFYAHEPLYKVTGSFVKPITLKRPFAQLNLATTKEDLEWAEKAGVVIEKSSVKVKGAVYSTLNTLSGYCADKVEGEFELALNAIPDAATEKLTITDSENQFDIDDYYYLSTSYLLASPKEALSEEIVFTLTAGANDEVINTLTVTNAPLQRNWRTNIIGEILTGEGTFNIVIDPIPEGDRNYPMDGSDLDIWDGTVTANLTPNAAGEYEINSAADLLALSNVDVTGKTIVLNKDLSFKNVETRAGDTTPATIEPLFAEGVSGIIFKGNDHVIRDFIINGEDCDMNSLFGRLIGAKVENLTVINADVKGGENDNDWAAIVAARAVNCTFENVTVKDSKLIGIQKIGGLIGYLDNDSQAETNIINCTIDGLTLNNHDVANESGATGGLVGHASGGKTVIQNSYVKNSTLSLIQNRNNAERANSKFIGVILDTNININNCGVENVTLNNSIEWTAYNDPFVGGNRGNSTLTVNGKTSVATVDELANALNAGKEVTLGADIAAEKAIHIDTDKEVTLDLNGHTITAGNNYNASPKGLIRIDGGATVTIKNGIVDASTYNGNISAVTVPNGKLIIESGTFMTGDDGTDCNDVIMANPESQVIVNGGTFQYKGQNGQRWLYTLNRPNSNHPVYTYTVNGGTFYQFIPGTTNPDGWGYEVQLGVGKKVYKNDETTPTTDTTPEAGAWYTVK